MGLSDFKFSIRNAAKLMLASLPLVVSKADLTKPIYLEHTPLRTHSLYAPYVDQDLQNRWFSFGGDAYVNTNKHIRLVQDRRSETGWLWSRLPINVANFVIELEFKISGGSSHLYGDGMAIWLTTERATFGPVFGSKDNFHGVGIFFDTYANSRHTYSFPRIQLMVNDGTQSYDLGNDGVANEAAACSANIRNREIKTKARITYIKGTSLKLELQYRNWDEWMTCFEKQDITLPAAPYLGFTAATGDVSDAHDIIAITTESIVVKNSETSASGVKPATKHGKSGESKGWGWFIIKFSLLGGVCAAAYEGYKMYNQKVLSKRF